MDISTEINSHNRTTLSITDYDFLKAFKEEGERIFFKLIHEQKRIAKSEDCILTDKDKDEYPCRKFFSVTKGKDMLYILL